MLRSCAISGPADGAALDRGETPGIGWACNLTGRLGKQSADRAQNAGETSFASQRRVATMGDLGFADDTALVGWASEMLAAEDLFVATLGVGRMGQPGENVTIAADQRRPGPVRRQG